MRLDDVYKKVMNDDKGKYDFEVELGDLVLEMDGKTVRVSDDLGYELNDYSTTQFFSKLGMPARYNKKLRKVKPELVANQANLWIRENSDKKVLMRTKNEYVRGVLSDKYTIMNNVTLLEYLLDELHDVGAKVEKFELTDKQFFLRGTIPTKTTEVREGDVLKVGFDIENSEVGYNSLRITPMVYRQVCSNGLRMWVNEGGRYVQRHIHVDKEEIDKRVVAAFHGVVNHNRELFEILSASTGVEMLDIESTIDSISENENLSNKLTERVKEHVQGETAYDLMNAFTRAARDIDNIDRRLEVEELAGRELTKIVNVA